MSIEELLKAMLSGAGPTGKGEQGAPSPLADLLGGALRGSQGPADLSRLLGGLLGGGADQEQAGIVEQTGLPAGLVQSALALVAGKLLAGRRAGAGQVESGVGGAVSLDDLLETMRSQGTVEENALRASGLPQELAAKTGIELPKAIQAIQAILALLTGKSAAKAPRRRSTAKSAEKGSTAKPRSAGRSSTPKAKSGQAPAGASKSSRAKKTDETAPTTPKKRSSTARTEQPAAKPNTRSRSTRTEEPATRPASRSRRPKTEEKPAEGLDDLLDKWEVTG